MIRTWFHRAKQPQHSLSRGRRPRTRNLAQTPRLESLEERTLLMAGALDPLFGPSPAAPGRSVIAFDFGNTEDDRATALTMQGDKIVVVGPTQRATAGNYDFAVARLNANGTPDATFGLGGKRAVAFDLGGVGSRSDVAHAVAIQGDKIVVAGYAQLTADNVDFAVARLNADGTPDLTFGPGGKRTIAFDLGAAGYRTDVARALAIQGDKIIVAGYAQLAADNLDFAVVRLNSDGTPDTSFGPGGKRTLAFDLGGGTGNNDAAFSAVLQPDNKIVLAGQVQRSTAGDYDFAVARLNFDGTPDTSFSADGKVVVFFDLGAAGGFRYDVALAVALQGDKIVVAGQAQVAADNQDFAVVRLNANGTPDTTFGTLGKRTVVFDLGGAEGLYDVAQGVAVQGDKIVLAGYAKRPSAGDYDFAVARLNADGTADQSFGFGGKRSFAFDLDGAPRDDRAAAVAFQADGRIVLAGHAGRATPAGNFDFAVARLENDHLQFSATAYSVAEAAGTAVITVQRISGTTGTVTVSYAASAGSASAGADFTAVSGTLTFGIGVTSQTFAVPIVNDARIEGDETVTLTLSNPIGGAGLASPATAVLTIQSDDVGGQIQFSAAGYTGLESAGSAVITVTRTGGAAEDISVAYATSDGTGKAGSEYVPASGPLTFGAGEGSKMFAVPLVSNGLVKTNRTITLTLSNPAGGGALGSLVVATLTLVDKDLPVVPDSPRPANLGAAGLGFAKSREQYTNLITGAYQRYLKRAPEPAGLNGWLELMLAGTVTEERLEAGFIGSPEYIAKNGGQGAGWITGMYKDLLGRDPTAAEVQAWLNALAAGMTEPQVAFGFAASRERQGQRVQRNYQTYLDRSASPQEVDAWVDLFAQGKATNQDIIAGFVASAEYYSNPAKGRGNRAAWIVSAYEQVLFRSPSVAEVNAWLAYLT